ncbi:MAG TPA: hypothetical protein VF203_12110 [Burkholderiales bacterium]
MADFLITMGTLGDRIGRRRLLVSVVGVVGAVLLLALAVVIGFSLKGVGAGPQAVEADADRERAA